MKAIETESTPLNAPADWVSLPEAARLAGVCYQTVWNWQRAGLLPTVQMPSLRHFVRKDDLQAFLKGRTGEAHE